MRASRRSVVGAVGFQGQRETGGGGTRWSPLDRCRVPRGGPSCGCWRESQPACASMRALWLQRRTPNRARIHRLRSGNRKPRWVPGRPSWLPVRFLESARPQRGPHRGQFWNWHQEMSPWRHFAIPVPSRGRIAGRRRNAVLPEPWLLRMPVVFARTPAVWSNGVAPGGGDVEPDGHRNPIDADPTLPACFREVYRSPWAAGQHAEPARERATIAKSASTPDSAAFLCALRPRRFCSEYVQHSHFVVMLVVSAIAPDGLGTVPATGPTARLVRCGPVDERLSSDCGCCKRCWRRERPQARSPGFSVSASQR